MRVRDLKRQEVQREREREIDNTHAEKQDDQCIQWSRVDETNPGVIPSGLVRQVSFMTRMVMTPSFIILSFFAAAAFHFFFISTMGPASR